MISSPPSTGNGPGRIRRGLSKLEELFWSGSQRGKLKEKSKSDITPEHYSGDRLASLSPASPTFAIHRIKEDSLGERILGNRLPADPAQKSGREKVSLGLEMKKMAFPGRFRSSSSTPAASTAASIAPGRHANTSAGVYGSNADNEAGDTSTLAQPPQAAGHSKSSNIGNHMNSPKYPQAGSSDPLNAEQKRRLGLFQNGSVASSSLLFQRQMSKMQTSRAQEKPRPQKAKDTSEFPGINSQQVVTAPGEFANITDSALRVRSRTFGGQPMDSNGHKDALLFQDVAVKCATPEVKKNSTHTQHTHNMSASPQRPAMVAAGGRGAFSEARIRRIAAGDTQHSNFTPDNSRKSIDKQKTPGSGSSAGSYSEQSMRQRSKTMQPSPTIHKQDRFRGVGFVQPDPNMPVEECSERIDKLLQRVQQTHREYTARQALTSPKTPTRFDIPLSPRQPVDSRSRNGRHQRKDTASTVSTISLGSDSADNAHDGNSRPPVAAYVVTPEEAERVLYSPRRRAATLDPAMSQTTSTPAARSSVKPSSISKAPTQEPRTAARKTTTTAEVRMKLEKLRARRAARLEAQAAGLETGSPKAASATQPEATATAGGARSANADTESPASRATSGLSGSTTYLSNDDADFFDNGEVVNMFQEIPLPLKDVEWDKRVYYYHVSQKNEAYRKATEEAEVGDYREECLVDLLGQKVATKVIAKTAAPLLNDSGNSMSATETVHVQVTSSSENDGSEELSGDDIDAIAAWIDEDNDLSSDDDCSFDWSRDGFGYMEFRRLSKASIASSMIMSPSNDEGTGGAIDGLAAKLHTPSNPAAAANTPGFERRNTPALPNTTPKRNRTAVGGGFATGSVDDSQAPSTSLMGATNLSSVWSISPKTARAAASNFNDAISSAAVPRGGGGSGASGSSNSSLGRELLSHLPGSIGRLSLSRRRTGAGMRGQVQQAKRPTTMYSDFMHALSRITEASNPDDSDGSWQMLCREGEDEDSRASDQRRQRVASGGTFTGGTSADANRRARLEFIRSENEQLRGEIEAAQRAIAALTRLVVRM
ncbi:hypothetical protein GGI12_000242 [Dipsacomyces acuminosporus]|nr:hypothetical protein GGI12_000242 [Dipsacomyces acuminosporus]